MSPGSRSRTEGTLMTRLLSRSPRRLLPLALGALVVALAGTALADAAADRIRATRGGDQAAWDTKVKLIMLANYDLDGSGWLDKMPEIQSVPCTTWGALDEGVRAAWGSPLRQIYGFEAGFAWVGSAIGFSEALRPQADASLAGCAARSFGDEAAPAKVDDLIRGLGIQGGSDEWDAAIKPLLVGSFDADRSGSIDSTEELLSMPCEVFVALDEGVRQKWPSGLRQTYGLKAGLSWLGFTLGFSDTVRAGVDMRAAGCLGVDAPLGPAPVPVPVPTPVPTTGPTHDRIRSVPGGGSSSWDTTVAGILRGAYDSDASGWLDAAAEVQAVTCDDWRALDDGVKAGWGYGLRTIYGFHPDYAWVGDAVGFSESLRTVADARIVQCLGGESSVGVAAPPTITDPASLIGSYANGGTDEWDEQVKQVLVAFYDANGSGQIDTKAEVEKITCPVWGAMDAGVKQRFPYGLRPVYGFPDGFSWNAHVLGFNESVRKRGDKALLDCGYEE